MKPENLQVLKRQLPLLLMLLAACLALFAPDVFAQDNNAEAKLCGVMGNVHTILKAVSIVIVTVAIIFAGYQIAFAHKRISDVAPVLIGGLLIGAAAQIATMMISNKNMQNGKAGCAVDTTVQVVHWGAASRA